MSSYGDCIGRPNLVGSSFTGCQMLQLRLLSIDTGFTVVELTDAMRNAAAESFRATESFKRLKFSMLGLVKSDLAPVLKGYFEREQKFVKQQNKLSVKHSNRKSRIFNLKK